MKVSNLTTPGIFYTEFHAPMSAPATFHPRTMFHPNIDREPYIRAMVQAIEDIPHHGPYTIAMGNQFQETAQAWLDPIFYLHGVTTATMAIQVGNGALDIRISAFQHDIDVLLEKEPLLMKTISAGGAGCLCKAISGIRHSHGDS